MTKKNLLDSLDHSMDLRSKYGKRFEFKFFFLFLIIAELAGANSIRKKEAYLKTHRRELGQLFGIHWHESPKRSAIMDFINQLNFDKMSGLLTIFESKKEKEYHIDGKVMCANGTHILNIFTEKTKQCTGMVEFSKGQEILAAYNVLKLGNFNPNDWVSLDAIHCQKKLS